MDALTLGGWVEVGHLGVIWMIEAIDAGLPGTLGSDTDATGPPVGATLLKSPSGLLLQAKRGDERRVRAPPFVYCLQLRRDLRWHVSRQLD